MEGEKPPSCRLNSHEDACQGHRHDPRKVLVMPKPVMIIVAYLIGRRKVEVLGLQRNQADRGVGTIRIGRRDQRG